MLENLKETRRYVDSDVINKIEYLITHWRATRRERVEYAFFIMDKRAQTNQSES